MKIDFYNYDSMFTNNTVTLTTMNPKHTIPIQTEIINTGRITVSPNRMYDSHKKVKIKATPTVGDTWHYKVPGAYALSTGYIKEVTAHTVVISNSRWADGVRYVTDEVEFVEKI